MEVVLLELSIRAHNSLVVPRNNYQPSAEVLFQCRLGSGRQVHAALRQALTGLCHAAPSASSTPLRALLQTSAFDKMSIITIYAGLHGLRNELAEQFGEFYSFA